MLTTKAVIIVLQAYEGKNEPMVAFICNRPSMYMSERGWVKDDDTGCLRDPVDILNYCRKVSWCMLIDCYGNFFMCFASVSTHSVLSACASYYYVYRLLNFRIEKKNCFLVMVGELKTGYFLQPVTVLSKLVFTGYWSMLLCWSSLSAERHKSFLRHYAYVPIAATKTCFNRQNLCINLVIFVKR